MELKYLSPFLDILEPPLRMVYPNQTAITALDIPIYQGALIQIYDVMRNLIVFVMGNAEASQMQEVRFNEYPVLCYTCRKLKPIF